MIRPGDMDSASMNARKKAKKVQLWNNRKPKSKSEWVALGELLITWAKTSDSVSIDDFAIQYNYGPHRIAKWVDDSEDFAEAWETATYCVGQRRNKLWKNTDKLLEKSLPLYDWRIRDYEEKLRQQEDETFNKNRNVAVYVDGVKHTEALDKHIKEKEESK